MVTETTLQVLVIFINRIKQDTFIENHQKKEFQILFEY